MAFAQGAGRTLVEFRAGKMNLTGTTVKPDPRKGMFQLIQDEDSLVHVIWKDRTTQQTEHNLIVFPGDATFTRLPQCTTGRAFVLKFPQTGKKLFLWMQEPKEDKDAEYTSLVSSILAEGASAGGQGGSGLDQSSLLAMLSGQSASQATPAAAPTAAPSASAGGSSVDSATIDAMIASIAQAQAQGSQSQQQQQQQRPAPGASLNDVLNADDVVPLLARHPDIVQALAPHLPEGNTSPEQVAELLRSPQFAQAVSTVDMIFSSGQGGQLMSSFGLDGAPAIGPDIGCLNLSVIVSFQVWILELNAAIFLVAVFVGDRRNAVGVI